MSNNCCNETGLADHAAVPCLNPNCTAERQSLPRGELATLQFTAEELGVVYNALCRTRVRLRHTQRSESNPRALAKAAREDAVAFAVIQRLPVKSPFYPEQ